MKELDYNKLAKKCDAQILDNVGRSDRGFIDTGILSLNFICSGKFVGGGLPKGSMAEIYGPSASGKSLIGTNLLKGVQKDNGISALVDAEHAVNKDFAIKASKIDSSKMVIINANTLQSCFNRVHRFIKTVREEFEIPVERAIGVVYDSIAVSPSNREFEETEHDMESTSETSKLKKEQPGERARICSAELRKLMPIVDEKNVAILFINQLRQKIGGNSMYDNTTTAGGGEALRYYCSTRLKISSSKQIKDSNGQIIGVNTNIKNSKSRFCSPFKQATNVRIYFEKGIDPFGGILELLLFDKRIEKVGGGGNYKVNDSFTEGKEVKFRSSLERNDVPIEVLLACPRLVDADSTSQIQYYLDMFGSAAEEVNNTSNTEENVSDLD